MGWEAPLAGAPSLSRCFSSLPICRWLRRRFAAATRAIWAEARGEGLGPIESPESPHPPAFARKRELRRATSPQPNAGIPEFGTLSWPKSETSDFDGGEGRPPHLPVTRNCPTVFGAQVTMG